MDVRAVEWRCQAIWNDPDITWRTCSPGVDVRGGFVDGDVALTLPALAYVTWSVDPILVDLGFLQIRWYGLLFACAFFLGLLIMRRVFALESRPEKDLDSLVVHYRFEKR